MSELKPCPFCGSKAELMHGCSDDWVQCTGCKAASAMHTMSSQAIEDWNRRVRD